jgi:hypothetical protein
VKGAKMSIFDNETLNIPCPNCQTQIPKTVRWIKDNSDFSCPSCDVHIEISKNDFIEKLTEADKALDSFSDLFKKISR